MIITNTVSPKLMLSKAINTAGTAAMIEPTVGTKLSKPARMPHKIAKSRPRIDRPIPTKRPVTILEAVLTARRSEEHTSELQSRGHLVCRLLLEKKKNNLHPSLALVKSLTVV